VFLRYYVTEIKKPALFASGQTERAMLFFDHCTRQDDTLSFAFGCRVTKLGVLLVLVQDWPLKLSSAYIISVRPAGMRTEDAQSFGTPLAASCASV